MTTTRIRITDLGGIATVSTYVAHSEADCQDDTDLSAYREAVRLQDVVTMGKIIAEPLPASKTWMHFPICRDEAEIKATLEGFGIDGKSKTPRKS